MKKIILITSAIFAYCILITANCFSQGAAINTNGAKADNSAILDISSHSQGQLCPRMSTTERNNIVSPANGLFIYNTDCNSFDYFDGTSWLPLNKNNSSSPAQPGAVSGPASVCPNSAGNNYSISAVPGANSYTWTVPTGFSITNGQGTAAITVTSGTQAGNIGVSAENYCGISTATTLSVSIDTAPSTPGAISGNVSVAPYSSGNVYTISPVSGATTYTWTVPSGANITLGQNTTSITVTFGASGGDITVTAGNACGTSAASILTVSTGTVETFTSSTIWTAPTGVTSVEYLVVAGGGGGCECGGGGGGGGVLAGTLSVTPGNNYTVTVGNGGAGTAMSNGGNGGNSVFASITASGGGGGGSCYGNPNGLSGGCGGGAGGVTGSAVGGSGTAGQGYAGGNNLTTGSPYPAGGGGGAGGTGGTPTTVTQAGDGGPGYASNITGTTVYYGGGGGGGFNGTVGTGGNGGIGGGGNGCGSSYSCNGSPGTVNTGGGGGGTTGGGTNYGGNGGSGIVIIKY